MGLDTDGFKEYITLDKKKKELSAELEQVGEQMKRLSSFLIENLESNEMSKISIAGKCCYVKNSSYAVIADKEKAIGILKENGYGDYIKEGYNANSISKLVRDLLSEEGKLPEQFGKIITIGTRTDLSVIAA